MVKKIMVRIMDFESNAKLISFIFYFCQNLSFYFIKQRGVSHILNYQNQLLEVTLQRLS